MPTMGAFHEGHLELMRAAGRECRRVVVSLFVNPTQFARHEDLSKYPRQEPADFDSARSVGVHHVFAPNVDVMYGGSTTMVRAGSTADGWEGSVRPGHFDGVATVVLKLLQIVRPRVAFFGLKDLQQCAVIRQMVQDFHLPVELRWAEVVRESSGLAMSSRNAYLSEEQRAEAAVLHGTLRDTASRMFADGGSHRPYLAEARRRLESCGFSVDYLAYVDPATMLERMVWTQGGRLMAAVRFGAVRLLDNVAVMDRKPPSP